MKNISMFKDSYNFLLLFLHTVLNALFGNGMQLGLTKIMYILM